MSLVSGIWPWLIGQVDMAQSESPHGTWLDVGSRSLGLYRKCTLRTSWLLSLGIGCPWEKRSLLGQQGSDVTASELWD